MSVTYDRPQLTNLAKSFNNAYLEMLAARSPETWKEKAHVVTMLGRQVVYELEKQDLVDERLGPARISAVTAKL